MMVSGLTLAYVLKNKLAFDNTILQSAKNKINNFLYPVAIIPINTIVHNQLYINDTITNNINYLNNFTTFFFSEIYTSEEINMINVYLTMLNQRQYTFSDEEYSLVSPYLSLHSNKIELEYCLDELRYKYLVHLVYGNGNKQEIDTLTASLALIEDAHNNFNINEMVISEPS